MSSERIESALRNATDTVEVLPGAGVLRLRMAATAASVDGYTAFGAAITSQGY